MTDGYISLDDRLFVPAATSALLWDLDGTLVDSLRFDLVVCSGILSSHAGRQIEIPEHAIREGFALSGADFWTHLARSVGVSIDAAFVESAFQDWEARRKSETFPINEGIEDILASARRQRLLLGVVSNNPVDEVERIVANSGLAGYFDAVVGNDGSGRAKKPAPDSYLFAARRLGVDISGCVAIEDSVLGLQSGRNAGTHVVAVATGAEDFARLRGSGLADCCYTGFARCAVEKLGEGQASVDITVSDDAVASLLRGLSAERAWNCRVFWNNDDWRLLGARLSRLVD